MSTLTSTNINTIEQVVEALERLGFRVEQQNGVSVSVILEQAERSFTVNFSIVNDGADLKTTCQIALLSNLVGDAENATELAGVFGNLLDLNSGPILPFATAILTGDETDSEDTPVVLTDSVPLGDLSFEEFEANVSGLRQALAAVLAQVNISG